MGKVKCLKCGKFIDGIELVAPMSEEEERLGYFTTKLGCPNCTEMKDEN